MLLNQVLRHDWTISFSVPAGSLRATGQMSDFAVRDVDTRDLRAGQLALLRLEGRTLPVAAAHFAEQLGQSIKSDRQSSVGINEHRVDDVHLCDLEESDQ